MKPAVIFEGTDDVAILRALLPPDLVEACELRPTGARSTLVSVARTLLIKHHVPVAVLIDTKTMNPTAIAETVRTTGHLLRLVAGDTPFEVIYCVPALEVIFFQDSVAFQRIFPQFNLCFLPQFALTQPKEQFEVLFEKGGGPRDLHSFLNGLTPEEVENMRTSYPIRQLISFVGSNLVPQAG